MKKILCCLLSFLLLLSSAPLYVFASAGPRVRNIELNRHSVILAVSSADEYTYLKADVMPDVVANTCLDWSSSDTDVVIVEWNDEHNLMQLIPLRPGKAVITVSSMDDSNVSDSCQVIVVPDLEITFTCDAMTVTEPSRNIVDPVFMRLLTYSIFGYAQYDKVQSYGRHLIFDRIRDPFDVDQLIIPEAFEGEESFVLTRDGKDVTIHVTCFSPDIKQQDENRYISYGIGHGGDGFTVRGRDDGRDVFTTYKDWGYTTTMKVGDESEVELVDFLFGKPYEYDGVNATITALMCGRDVRIKYKLKNVTDKSLSVKIGSSMDTEIDQDYASIVFLTKEGIKMAASDWSYSFAVRPGFRKFTTRWYGPYYDARDNVFVGSGDMGLLTDTDSGAAWSWTVDIPAKAVVVRTAVISFD